MSILIKLGQRLKEIRINSDLKQKDLASYLGIQAALLSMYEQGKREPSIKFLEKFSKYFNISLGYLFSKIDQNEKIDPAKNFDTLLLEMKDLLTNLEKTATK